MKFRYYVAYRGADGMTTGTELTVASPLDGAAGRSDALHQLVARGVDRPQITGWAPRSADLDTATKAPANGRVFHPTS